MLIKGKNESRGGGGRGGFQAPVVSAGERIGNREAKPRAFGTFIDLVEAVENMSEIFFWDGFPVVFY